MTTWHRFVVVAEDLPEGRLEAMEALVDVLRAHGARRVAVEVEEAMEADSIEDLLEDRS